MRSVETVEELRRAVSSARTDGRIIGFVPTMGALHDGHLSLVRRARAASGFVVVSIFVNPLQFVGGEDFDRYPRDLERDSALLGSLGRDAPDLLFAPAAAAVYPTYPGDTKVHVAGITDLLEGAARPGHFDGVTTVVAKLFNLVQPGVAFFGRKDFQQLQVVRRMVADLNVPVDVVGAPTVREPGGLAMSSRNAYLSPPEHEAAGAISAGLAAAVRWARAARSDSRTVTAGRLREEVVATIRTQSLVRVEYVEVVDPTTLRTLDSDHMSRELDVPVDERSPWLIAVACHVGSARLIDNVVVGDAEDETLLLAAVDGGAA